MAEYNRSGSQISRMVRRALSLPLTMRRLSAHYGALRWRAAANVAVFPELGLAYNRIKKNANTSVLLLLQQMAQGKVDNRKDVKRKTGTLLDLSRDELRTLDRLHLFVVIRNPYSRVLSAFLDRFRNPDYRHRYGPFDLTPEGFGEFLVWLENGGMSRNGHWNYQRKRMILPLAAYDSVIRFENFREELVNMLNARDLNIPEDCLQELFPADRDKRTSASKKLEQYYNAEKRDRVARLYAVDFKELGYPVAFPGNIIDT